MFVSTLEMTLEGRTGEETVPPLAGTPKGESGCSEALGIDGSEALVETCSALAETSGPEWVETLRSIETLEAAETLEAGVTLEGVETLEVETLEVETLEGVIETLEGVVETLEGVVETLEEVLETVEEVETLRAMTVDESRRLARVEEGAVPLGSHGATVEGVLSPSAVAEEELVEVFVEDWSLGEELLGEVDV